MNAKVLALVASVEAGYEIASIEDGMTQGGMRIRLTRGNERRSLWFEHFELPAVMQECSCVGVAK